ncbi:MAG: SIS domain-containing protein [Lachnospiraceae bacterium]|nr:SIS domain-containing protein [Lachnospiraceae bacterium]
MKYLEYYNIIKGQLEQQFTQEGKKIEAAARYCADSIQKGRLIHAFGCAHSQIFAMEVFYRAGGLIPVNALLLPHFALFPNARLSTLQERMEGFSAEYLAGENTNKADTMLIASISGRNAAVIDMALAAQEIGMKVVALVSEQFSADTTSRHSGGKNLKDVADLVIDVKCVSGDAVLQMDGLETSFCGTSTVLGVAVVEAIIAQTVEFCVQDGYNPPIYVSANLDRGDGHNAKYMEKYADMISCL